jgi:short subunit dehydrogenase-like uncharacterized protein
MIISDWVGDSRILEADRLATYETIRPSKNHPGINMKFDIIVYGATSFVGQILCRYLATRTLQVELKSLKWALAGRSKAKLEEIRKEITGINPSCAELSLIVADAADAKALQAMITQTKVVVSTVGPYALYGDALVQLCAESGVDYCDLTGEAQWMRKMIVANAAAAQKSGARIVHACGFDSIPSDFGVWFAQREARQRFGEPLTKIAMRVKAMRGAASGGTVASIMNIVKEARSNPTLRKELMNPYSICPPGYKNNTRQPLLKGAKADSVSGGWIAPFVMAAVNTRVVFRSNALSSHAYGEKFEYDEAMMVGRGIQGRMRATTLTVGLGGFLTASAFGLGRWALEKFVVPAPGEGPSKEAQEKGFYDLRFFGRTEDGQSVNTKVTGDRDPGYGSTGKMLGEAALCLALDKPAVKGGFWTPTTAMGDALFERLKQHAGLKFELLEAKP